MLEGRLFAFVLVLVLVFHRCRRTVLCFVNIIFLRLLRRGAGANTLFVGRKGNIFNREALCLSRSSQFSDP